MVLIGGAGSLFGPVLGAAVVMYIERVLSSAIPVAETVLGLVFVAFVLLARQGIVGVGLAAWARVRHRSRSAILSAPSAACARWTG